MTFEDFAVWAANASFENELEQQVLNRIVDYVAAADASPGKDFHLSLLGGMLAKDRDAFALALRNNPDWANDLQKAIYGEAWSWKPNQVAQLLDFGSPEEMFKEDEETKLPSWKRRFTSDDPEKMAEDLKSYYLDEQNIDPNQLVKWLQTEQGNRDRQKKYSSPGYSLYSMISPRQVEAWKQGKESSGKDVALDMAENVLQLLPIGRLGQAITKVAPLGLKAIGALKKPVAKVEKFVKGAEPVIPQRHPILEFIADHPQAIENAVNTAQAVTAPLALEIADAEAYDADENLRRSEFNLRDAAEGTLTNLATPMVVGGLLSRAGRRSGLWGSRANDLADQLGASDPYVTSMISRFSSRLGSKGPTAGKTFTASLEKDAAILDEVEKAMRDYTKAKKQQQAVKGWRSGLADPQKEKIAAVQENLEIPDHPGITESYKSEYNNQNPYNVSETRALKEQGIGDKYGMDEAGNLIFIKKDYNKAGTLSDNPKITIPVGPKERSFNKLREDELDALEAKAKAAGQSFDRDYPGRILDIDKKIQEKAGNETVKKFRAGAKAGLLTQAVKNYTANKLGKDQYGSGLAAMIPGVDKEAIDELDYSGSDDTARAILNDPDMVRMWEAGFIPHENEADPLWRMYKYYKENMKGKKK